MLVDSFSLSTELDVERVCEQFFQHGYVKLGSLCEPSLREALCVRADELMLGTRTYEGMFFQLDTPSGKYEEVVFGRGYEGPSLDYRKIEKLEKDPLFLSWIEHPRFAPLLTRLLGASLVIYRAVLFNKGPSGGSNLPWHQDGGAFWGLSEDPTVQIWTALDDAPEGGGCLEIVPNTHTRGLATPLGGVVPQNKLDEQKAEEHAVSLPVKAGEVILLHNHLWHRSSRGIEGSRRRAFTVCYMPSRIECTRRKKAPRIFFPVFQNGVATKSLL